MNEKPKIYKIKKLIDNRGSFMKLLSKIQNEKILNKKKLEVNISYNKKRGTVRGFHYQTGKYKEKN